MTHSQLLTLQTGDTDIAQSDVLGKFYFKHQMKEQEQMQSLHLQEYKHFLRVTLVVLIMQQVLSLELQLLELRRNWSRF